MRPITAALIVALALGILSAPLAADAQQAAKVYRIGFLWTTSLQSAASFLDAFRHGLREIGYIEGQNIALEQRWAADKVEQIPGLAAELVGLKVDIIVTQGTPAARAAKEATTTVPIVMVNVGDPVGSGLVASLARPGGNITGLSLLSPELNAKRLELLKEVVPKISRVAVFWDPIGAAGPRGVTAIKEAAPLLRLQLQILEVRGANDFNTAFREAAKSRAQALLVLPSPILGYHRKTLADLAAKNRLPAMYQAREFVDAGGLMSYGPSLPNVFRRAATYVDKILKGAKPADLPVEQPTRFELVVNLKTAKALGLTIPQSILIRADHVIK